MMQLKAIFSDLLRYYDFELAQDPDSYKNDHSKMVVQIQQPCCVRYRRRHGARAGTTAVATPVSTPTTEPGLQVRVDRDLCQGHAVCAEEAPGVFELDPKKHQVRVLDETPRAELGPRVERAVRHCPTRALRLEAPSEIPPRTEATRP